MINQRGSNTLRVEVNGDLFVLYINGTRVNSVVDIAHRGDGWLGVKVYGGQQVAFDNLSVEATGSGKLVVPNDLSPAGFVPQKIPDPSPVNVK